MYQVHCLKAETLKQKDIINAYLCKKQFEDINKCLSYAEKLSFNYPNTFFSVEFERKDKGSYMDEIKRRFKK